jgi:hypothetical protein
MKKLDFVYPFTGFSSLNFTNCFTSLYMYLENYAELYDFNCKEFCCYCGMCSVPWAGVQTRLFFLFDTISGRSAAQNKWGNQYTDIFNEIYDTDETIDFLFGFTGYGYKKYTESIADKIRTSIDNGIPALVRLKDSGQNTFRIITGYDSDNFIQANSDNKEEPTLENITAFYQVTGKTERKYTLLDGLKQIKKVFEFNRDTKLWDEYINAFQYNHGHTESVEDIQRRFNTAKDAMNWNCHNFGMAMGVIANYERVPEQLENRIWDEWKNPAFLPAFNRIGTACDLSHTRQWQIHALQKVCCKSPTERHDGHTEWGLFECAVDALKFIKVYDDEMYDAVCEMIGLL